MKSYFWWRLVDWLAQPIFIAHRMMAWSFCLMAIFFWHFLYWRVTWSIFLWNRCSQISIFLCNGYYRVDDWNENMLEADLTCLICDNPCSGLLILSECSLKPVCRIVDFFCMKKRFYYTVLVVLEFPWPQGSLVLSTAQNGSWIIVC